MKIVEVVAALETLEQEMKGYEFGVDLAHKKLSAGIALRALDALQAYLCGEPESAAEDFAALAEELKRRSDLSDTSHEYRDPYE